MVDRVLLSDEQWVIVLGFLRGQAHVRVGEEADCRRFVDAVMWILRSGAQWRMVPPQLGNWNSVFKRFSRWCQAGIWEALHRQVSDRPDLQQVFLDSTVVRANACAAGAKGSNARDEALGRSRGGFSTKIHTVVDALGNPLEFVLTGGEASDIGQAERLVASLPEGVKEAVADKGYDSDGLVNFLRERAIQEVIPSRRNRKMAREYDRHAYKERHLVECFFSKIKYYRRIFSRFEKTARNFMGFLRLVATLIWLR